MVLIINKLLSLYDYTFNELSDPRINQMFLMGSPLNVVAIVGLYLLFVLKWGPKFMENRKPFNIDKILIVYNAIQIAICGYLVTEGIREIYWKGEYNLLCQPVDKTNSYLGYKVSRCCHIYFLTKVLDLLDTVFFVLRKKNNQISFLHLYHHAGMVVLIWNGIKFFPGGQSVFTGFINSLVHVIMYTYYLVTAFNKQYKNNLWWKKYITQMQIIQFFLITLHWSALLVKSCGFPKWPAGVMIPQNFFMLSLFYDFYRKAYYPKKKSTTNGYSNHSTTNGTNGKSH